MRRPSLPPAEPADRRVRGRARGVRRERALRVERPAGGRLPRIRRPADGAATCSSSASGRSRAWRLRLTVLATVVCAGAGIAFLVATVATWMSFWDQLGGFLRPAAAPDLRGPVARQPQRVRGLRGADVRCRGSRAPRARPPRRARSPCCSALLVARERRPHGQPRRLARRGAGRARDRRSPGCDAARVAPSSSGRPTRARRRPLSRRASSAEPSVVAGVCRPQPPRPADDLSGAGVRTSFLAASARMFADSPLTGLGPGAWTPARLAFTDAGRARLLHPARPQRPRAGRGGVRRRRDRRGGRLIVVAAPPG